MNFRQLRERAGLSQYRLALLSDVEQTTISQLELGKVRDPRWSTVSALAAALNATPVAVAKAIEHTTKRHASVGRRKKEMRDESPGRP